MFKAMPHVGIGLVMSWGRLSSYTVYRVIYSIDPFGTKHYDLWLLTDEKYCSSGSGIDEKILLKWKRN